MPNFNSQIDTKSDEFKTNAKSMAALVDHLNAVTAKTLEGGGATARERHLARGKMLPRQRIDALIDPGAPFLELSQLAAHGVYEEEISSAGIITGIGPVSGRECVIVANDATVKGGSYFPLTVKKHIRAQEIAKQNKMKVIK